MSNPNAAVYRFRIEAAELAASIGSPLVYLVPSRGRPANIDELVAAWDPYDDGVADLVIALDEDDPTLAGYVDALELPECVHILVGPRLRLGGTLNALAPMFADRGRVAVGFMGDDHRPRTRGWSERILDAHRRRPFAVVYGDDLVRGADLPTAVSIDARIVDTLGYFVPPGMVHLYLDDYWRRLGAELGTLTYLDDVIIEHCHPTAGTAAMDDRYAEVNHPDVYAADRERFESYLADLHPAAMQALEPVMVAELRRLELAVARQAATDDEFSLYDPPERAETPPERAESVAEARSAPTHQTGQGRP